MAKNKAAARDQAKGCGCLAAVFLVLVSCGALLSGNDPKPPAASHPTPSLTHTPSWTPEPVQDLDKAGDVVPKTRHLYADVGRSPNTHNRDTAEERTHKRKPTQERRRPKTRDRGTTQKRHHPKRTRKPRPEPAPLARAHPGGFCGTPGAVGIASNGRTYTCLGGHWRR